MHESAAIPAERRPPRLIGFLAEFETPAALKAAARALHQAGYTRFDAHSPFPIHGIDPLMGIRPTRLPLLVFGLGLLGLLTAFVLQWWTNATSWTDFRWVPTFLQGYNFRVSGKPDLSLPANIPIMFELTVLFAALTTGIGMLAFNNLPWWSNPLFRSARFRRATNDRFFVSVEACDAKFNVHGTRDLLATLQPSLIETIEDPQDDAPPPRVLGRAALVLACAALIPLAIVWAARSTKSSVPRIHIIQDMDNQDRFKAQQALPLFADGRAMRPPVGATSERPLGVTVARGELRMDDHFYSGWMNNDYVTTFPSQVKLDDELLQRGQARFNIYCAPCHGQDGHGNGHVNLRALELGGKWVAAVDLHDAERRSRPVGQIFNSITSGVRTMPAYGGQIKEADRWAIVAYVRALQRSTSATIEDVPAERREEVQSRAQ